MRVNSHVHGSLQYLERVSTGSDALKRVKSHISMHNAVYHTRLSPCHGYQIYCYRFYSSSPWPHRTTSLTKSDGRKSVLNEGELRWTTTKSATTVNFRSSGLQEGHYLTPLHDLARLSRDYSRRVLIAGSFPWARLSSCKRRTRWKIHSLCSISVGWGRASSASLSIGSSQTRIDSQECHTESLHLKSNMHSRYSL